MSSKPRHHELEVQTNHDGAILKTDHLTFLLARCALQDQQAFVELYEATSAKLFTIALRILKREALAEEVLQDAYMKIWRSADCYNQSRGRPMTWLINIVRNQSFDLMRRVEYKKAGNDVELDESLPCHENPLQHAATSSELERLQHSMKRLSSDQQTCILLIYHEGYTPTEVARLKNWPLGTVKTWMRRGLQHIRDGMQRGVTIIGTKTYAKASSHSPKCNGRSSPMAIGPASANE